MNAKIAILLSAMLCGSATAEPGQHAQPNLSLTAERIQSEVTTTGPSISEEDAGTRAAAELPSIEATTNEEATPPQPDPIEPNENEETNTPAPVAVTGAMVKVGSRREAGASGFIAGLLAIVFRACAAAILRRGHRIGCTKGQALQSRAMFIEPPAFPMTGRALSPDAALARIEEIRRSLLDLTCSPNIAPSRTFEEKISRIATEITRPAERMFEPI